MNLPKSVKILWITSELHPIAKAGGLGDVSLALPKAILALGQDIRICLPYYNFISLKAEKVTSIFNNADEEFNIFITKVPETNIPLYLIQNRIFDGENIYESERTSESSDKFVQYGWVINKFLEQFDWKPDIIQTNDWPCGPAIAFIRQRKDLLRISKPKIVFTIHNLAYQGSYETKFLERSGLKENYLESLREKDNPKYIRYLRLAIKWSDRVMTVSETYAKEILTAEYSYGLETDLISHKETVGGIVHGIDEDEWNPECDAFLSQTYNFLNLDRKAENKRELQSIFKLPTNSNTFLAGIVTRLVYQKGIELILDLTSRNISKNIQLVILGSGDKELESKLQELSHKFPDKVSVYIGYNQQLSHKLIAGIDVFLVPSRYEPCGLTQLYSMKYGTVPVVRKTGGLADTVHETEEIQNGFVFQGYNVYEFEKAFLRAYNMFKVKEKWREIQISGMKQDFSWNKPANMWINIYQNMSK